MSKWLASILFVVSAHAVAQGLPEPFYGASIIGAPTSSTLITAQAVIDPCYQALEPGQVTLSGNTVTWAVDVRGLVCPATPPPPYAIGTSFGPLQPGTYTLLVRARDPLTGQLGPPLAVPFGVTPAIATSVPLFDRRGLSLLVVLVVIAALVAVIAGRKPARNS